MIKFVFVLVAFASVHLTAGYQRTALKYHNKYRALHGAAPLQLDDELNQAAEEYATALIQSNGRARPKQPAKLGQNLFQYYSGGAGADIPSDDDLVEQAVDSWYSDIKTYDWANPKTSTFSQVVWRATDKLGVAVRRNGRDRIVIVAIYSPPGNVLGQFQQNVYPVGDYPPEVTSTAVPSSTVPPSSSTGSAVVGGTQKVTFVSNVDERANPTTAQNFVVATTSQVLRTTQRVNNVILTTKVPAQAVNVPTSTAQVQRPTQGSSGQSSVGTQGSSGQSSVGTQGSSGQSSAGTQVSGQSSGGTTSAPLPSGPIAEVSERDVQILAVDLHNSFREKHGTPPLRLDEELTRAAQDYAYSLASGKSKRRTEHGQNLFWFSGFSLPPDEAVRKAVNEWYNANSVYNWQTPLSSPNAANSFSQLVWKASRKIGIGVATKRNGNVVVALYGPPGNILSNKAFNENVPALV